MQRTWEGRKRQITGMQGSARGSFRPTTVVAETNAGYPGRPEYYDFQKDCQRTNSLKIRLLDSCFAFNPMGFGTNLHLPALCDRYICRRFAFPSHPGVLHFVNNIHSVDNLAEDDMFVIEKWCGNLKHAFSKPNTL